MKILFVLYLDKKNTQVLVEEMLSVVFNTNEKQIGQLLDNVSHEIVIDFRDFSIHPFNWYELCVFVPTEMAEKVNLTNNLSFGREVSKYLGSPVILDDESDDPYQYLMIKDERLFLLDYVEEPRNFEFVNETFRELSFERASEFLHSIDRAESAYQVKDSRLWLSCVKS